MRYTLLFIAALSLSFPVFSQLEKIETSAGPEDIFLDLYSSEQARLLISCDARRDDEAEEAEIWAYEPETAQRYKLKRSHEPQDFAFHPHGIYVHVYDGRSRLYVVNHEDEKEQHGIAVYKLSQDRIVFEEYITGPELNSPNALTVLENGDLLITNDSKKRGSRMEGLLKKKGSTIYYYDRKSSEFSLAAKKISYANGINHKGSRVFVASTRQNAIFEYELQDKELVNKKEIARVEGADNLRWDGEDLLVAGHPKILAFVKHAKDGEKLSPCEVWRVPTNGDQASLLLYSDGGLISAASSAIIYQNNIYIAQVFNPFVLRMDGF
jgi:arylesterase/paraoxonase